MLRLLRYVVLFFLGYAIIKMLFGKKKAVKEGETKFHHMNEQAGQGEHKYDKDSGEYIDYEEVK